jgi:hypothetical protein
MHSAPALAGARVASEVRRKVNALRDFNSGREKTRGEEQAKLFLHFAAELVYDNFPYFVEILRLSQTFM